MTTQTFETGDETYEERLKRYEYIVARRAERPQPSLRALAKEMGISPQNIHRQLKRGVVKPSGRPRSDAARRRRLVARIGKWQTRRTTKIAAGKPVEVEDQWIAKLEAQLRDLA